MIKIVCPLQNKHTKNCLVSIFSDIPLVFECECGCIFKRQGEFEWEIIKSPKKLEIV